MSLNPTEPYSPPYPAGIAEVLRHALEAPPLNITLSMRVMDANPVYPEHLMREWLRMKPEYVRREFVDAADIAVMERVLAGPSTLAASLLAKAILCGLHRKYVELGGAPSLKHAAA